MKESISTLILKSLLINSEYAKYVFPALKYEYFEREEDKKIVKYLKGIYEKYNTVPSIQVIKTIFIDKVKNISETTLSNILDRLNELNEVDISENDIDYLMNLTQEFIINRDFYLNLVESIKIVTDERTDRYNSIPSMLENSLKITLKEKNLGSVYGSDKNLNEQYEYYTERKIKYETHLLNFNKYIGGGFERKTLNIFLGEPGIGKSRLLADLSAHYIKSGLNVLYVSLELSENAICQRMDANLLDININELKNITKSNYIQSVNEIKKLLRGRLIVKEYPAEGIDSRDIKILIEEIKRNMDVNIDVLVLDYLTIMKSAKNIGINVGNLYVNGKIISNELHSIAKEYNLILLSALHLNRSGWGNLDVKLANIAESAGISHVADFMAALVSTDPMRNKRRLVVSILKNRLFSMGDCSRFFIGFDDSRMKHFDVNEDISEFLDENEKKEVDFSEFKFNS